MIYERKRKIAAKLAGLCIRCNKPNFNKSLCCKKCCSLMTKIAMVKYNFRKTHSLCVSCGKTVRLKIRCRRCYLIYRVRLLPESERKNALKALKNFQNKCPICKTRKPGGRGEWHLDHNHKTKKFRGILCSKCNIALGCVQDDPNRLLKLIKYLRTTP